MKIVSTWMVMGVLALALGCDGADRTVSPLLQPLQSCFGVEDAVRQTALENMNKAIEENMQRALAGAKSGGYCGPGYGYDSSYKNGGPSPAAGGATSSPSSSRGASQTSGTNNQVAGVDEADFVKNDNKNIYVLGSNFFRIVKAWPASQMRELSKVAIEGDPKKLFIHGKYAVVYSSLPIVASGSSSKKASPSSSYSSSSNECSYGYNCTFTGDGRPTLLTVFDISDLTRPVKIREVRTTGSYLNARRIGDAVYTVISSKGVTFPGVRTWPTDLGYCGKNSKTSEQIEASFEYLRMANTMVILATPIDSLLPQVEDTRFMGGKQVASTQVLGQCQGFYKSSLGGGSQFTTLLGVDITGRGKAHAGTIVSKPGAVYASASALYMSVPLQNMSSYRWGGYGLSSQEEVSTVHKFSLRTSDASMRYAGSGVVKGRVLNQFGMDEYQGHLRIATTTGRLPSTKVHSTLSVLRQSGKRLSLAGVVDHLAPKEDIRSVRFDGARAFMVTFKKTDPLFTFDLSSPSNPRVVAELKIPGFSTYMHMLDKGHLLTIGYDANDQGSFAWFTGVMLQIFDVRNMSSPKRIFREVIGTRGSSSVALNNHLAFTYFGPKNLLALPMTVCEGGSGGGSYGNNMTFSGLMVYDVTARSGFSLRGKVAHKPGSGVTCRNWWTRANSQVKRSIIMDDYVYSISGEQIKVNHRNNLSVDIASVKIK